ncbi:hypothetical protein BH23DEI1_BH23DEI1_22140 [soil metagenome]|nr:hypothetical protein [Trueperaceae bacterium]
MMRELPSFADLMLLPGVVEHEATVFLKGDQIAVRTDAPARVVKEMSSYPHVRVHVDADGHVVLEAREARHRRLLLVWPTGKSQGAFIWERGFFSVVDPSLMTALVAAGCAVDAVECSPGETTIDVLARLPRVPSEPFD